MTDSCTFLRRNSHRAFMLIGIGLAAIIGVAAAEPDSAISLDNLSRICIRGTDGKPAFEATQDGNLKVKKLTLLNGKEDADVATELKKSREETERLHAEMSRLTAALDELKKTIPYVDTVLVKIRGKNCPENIHHPGEVDYVAAANGGSVLVKEYGKDITPLAAWWGPSSIPESMKILPNYTHVEIKEGQVKLFVNQIPDNYDRGLTYINVYVQCLKRQRP